MLPPWFVLKLPPDIDISIEEWKNHGENRARLLENLKGNPATAVNQFMPEAQSTSKEYENLTKGSLFLRLVAASSPRMESWLIESEGDLFDYLFLNLASKGEQTAIIRFLLGEENIMTLGKFQRKFDEEQNNHLKALAGRSQGREGDQSLLVVKYTEVPWMVANRRGYLRRGYVIGELRLFRGSLKVAFEKKLRRMVKQARLSLGQDSNVDEAVKDLENNLLRHVQIGIPGILSRRLEGEGLYLRLDIFPPCMRLLYTQFESTGALLHNQRLQLGIFLKRLGMSTEEQELFWYEKSVDNVGMTLEEFSRRAGYQIRHLYGLEGGRKDYEVPKCKTIATSYFCPFSHMSLNDLRDLVSSFIAKAGKEATEDSLNKILLEAANKRTILACNSLFSILISKPKQRISHPLTWVELAIGDEKA